MCSAPGFVNVCISMCRNMVQPFDEALKKMALIATSVSKLFGACFAFGPTVLTRSAVVRETHFPLRTTLLSSDMNSTLVSRHIHAPRAMVYRTLLDAEAIAHWKVPDGMTCQVHEFDAREGGSIRVSLTYDAPGGAGKTTPHTDTYRGRFALLVKNERVVEVDEFETDDPAMRGEMTITVSLTDADGGTELVAVHEGLPSGVSSADNETGWHMSLAKLAALVETRASSRTTSAPRLIDVSHTIEHGMITYKGLPAPVICDWLSREASRANYGAGTEFQISKIEMVANTGTYVDSPFHRYAGGKDLSELPLESLANLDCVVVRVDAAAGPAIDRIPLTAKEVAGRAVLFCTDWDRHWRTEAYFEGHPFLTERAAEWLAKAGATLVGIDSHNIDDTATGERPVHTVLLGSEIPIVEHLRGLAALPATGSRFFAVPVKVKAMGTFPVRAFAMV